MTPDQLADELEEIAIDRRRLQMIDDAELVARAADMLRRLSPAAAAQPMTADERRGLNTFVRQEFDERGFTPDQRAAIRAAYAAATPTTRPDGASST